MKRFYPSVSEISLLEQRMAQRIRVLSQLRPLAEIPRQNFERGLKRIRTKAVVARTMASFMNKKKIRAVQDFLECPPETKRELSARMRKFMSKANIRTANELAFWLYIGSDYVDAVYWVSRCNCTFLDEQHIEAVEWMRYPVAFRSGKCFTRRHDEYLLALCDVEYYHGRWNHVTKTTFL